MNYVRGSEKLLVQLHTQLQVGITTKRATHVENVLAGKLHTLHVLTGTTETLQQMTKDGNAAPIITQITPMGSVLTTTSGKSSV